MVRAMDAEKFGNCAVGNANNTGSLWYRNNTWTSTWGPYFNGRLAGPTYSFQVKPLPVNTNCEYRLPSSGHTGGIFVEEPEGALWLAAPWGLGRLSPDGAWRLYTRRDGLPDTAVNALCLDA